MSFRSATLNDIYRHHNNINDLEDSMSPHKPEFIETDKSAPISTTFEQEYHSVPDALGIKRKNFCLKLKIKTIFLDYVYDAGSHGHAPPTHYHHPTSYIEKSYKKGDKLADIFEIALTALAYLSFGVFIVHLIMSISAIVSF